MKMHSWTILVILAVFVSAAVAAGPAQAKDKVAEHHGPTPEQKAKLREKQTHFMKRAKEIKEDDSLSQEEKEKELHKLREHAMLYMGPHALLPHALLKESPIPEVEEKRQQLIKAVEFVAVSELEFDEKKRELEQLRDHFKSEVNAIHRKLSDSEVKKVRSSLQKESHADAYKRMIHDGIRSARSTEARGRAFNEAVYRGIQQITAGLKDKQFGEYRKSMADKRMARDAKTAYKKRGDAKESRSRPDF